MPLEDQLGRARELIGYSQDDAASALGVSRAMISYWESGKRRPNDLQLTALARLYRVPVEALRSEAPLTRGADLAQMLLRSQTDLPHKATPGVREFVDFLDRYSDLAEMAGENIRGMTESPFVSRAEFNSENDVRRKAEEVRAFLRLGLGPVSEIDPVCELLGITVYRAELGGDLSRTISGAFLNHPSVGFSILVNLDMTPGRRRFTIAHEIAHALLHSGTDRYVISRAKHDPSRERLADLFASEFLMPAEGMRRFMEENAIGPRITDAADVVHLQRYFQVSYPTALVRLRRARLLSQERYEEFSHIRPVLLARALGYEIEDEEYRQQPGLWRIARYPRRFLQLLRTAVQRDLISVPTAAELAGLGKHEIQNLISEQREEGIPKENQEELKEYVASGVV